MKKMSIKGKESPRKEGSFGGGGGRRKLRKREGVQ